MWLAHASGFFQAVGPIFSGIDGAISTVTDVRKLAASFQAPEATKKQKRARIGAKEKRR